eukprot:4767336-Amphidinium_carterae.1
MGMYSYDPLVPNKRGNNLTLFLLACTAVGCKKLVQFTEGQMCEQRRVQHCYAPFEEFFRSKSDI